MLIESARQLCTPEFHLINVPVLMGYVNNNFNLNIIEDELGNLYPMHKTPLKVCRYLLLNLNLRFIIDR